ncbi:hypothetical protein B0H66DRAFT_531470 [Apodospora peruviana]|uniref:Uncharacterized protein n=1 Tax=Apodospora peruviana TaxID=516989 RepID=A0AAE0IBK5_9PEZI|nr:hypothetical protein B0H66DRAFT_531470 [Apodospora peruviana]
MIRYALLALAFGPNAESMGVKHKICGIQRHERETAERERDQTDIPAKKVGSERGIETGESDLCSQQPLWPSRRRETALGGVEKRLLGGKPRTQGPRTDRSQCPGPGPGLPAKKHPLPVLQGR